MERKDIPNSYSVYTKYGRVGAVVGSNMDESNILDKALKTFTKTFKQKTSKAKGYTEIEVSFEKKEPEKTDDTTNKKYAPSKLDP